MTRINGVAGVCKGGCSNLSPEAADGAPTLFRSNAVECEPRNEFKPGNIHHIICSNPDLCPLCPSIKWRLEIHYYDSIDTTMPCRLDRLPLDPTCTVAKLRETISLRSGWTNFELRAKDAEREIGFTLYDADIVKDAVQTGEVIIVWAASEPQENNHSQLVNKATSVDDYAVSDKEAAIGHIIEDPSQNSVEGRENATLVDDVELPETRFNSSECQENSPPSANETTQPEIVPPCLAENDRIPSALPAVSSLAPSLPNQQIISPSIPVAVTNKPISYTVTPFTDFFATLHAILWTKSQEPVYKVVVICASPSIEKLALELLRLVGDVNAGPPKKRKQKDRFPKNRGVIFLPSGSGARYTNTTMVIYIGLLADEELGNSFWNQTRETQPLESETLLLFTSPEHEAIQKTPHIFDRNLDQTPGPTSAKLSISRSAIQPCLAKISLDSRQAMLNKLLARNYAPVDGGEMALREMLAL